MAAPQFYTKKSDNFRHLFGMNSDHAMRFITIEVNWPNKYPYYIRGMTYNVLAKCHSKEDCTTPTLEGEKFSNNPGNITEDIANYKDRKLVQLQVMCDQILRKEIDFALLQECDWLRYTEIEAQYKKNIGAHGWGIIYRQENSGKSNGLVILYNKVKLEFRSAELLFFDGKKHHGLAADFIITANGQSISLTNIHLAFNLDYRLELFEYLIRKFQSNTLTVVGGDHNSADQSMYPSTLTGVGATNFSLSPIQGYELTHYCINQTAVPKCYDSWAIVNTLQLPIVATVAGGFFSLSHTGEIQLHHQSNKITYEIPAGNISLNKITHLVSYLQLLDEYFVSCQPQDQKITYKRILDIYQFCQETMHIDHRLISLPNIAAYAHAMQRDASFSDDYFSYVFEWQLSETAISFITEKIKCDLKIFLIPQDESTIILFDNENDANAFSNLFMKITETNIRKQIQWQPIADTSGYTITLNSEECVFLNSYTSSLQNTVSSKPYNTYDVPGTFFASSSIEVNAPSRQAVNQKPYR